MKLNETIIGPERERDYSDGNWPTTARLKAMPQNLASSWSREKACHACRLRLFYFILWPGHEL